MFAKNLEVTQTNLMRTVGALKSLKISQDAHFDVAHYEQNIKNVKPNLPIPPTIQELMQSIVVYVEVRTGEDNRSSGVKKVIAALGAQVNDKLLRNTTHVIFKDGLLSTYKKAKNWNIPIVSILWIEACKEQRKICDPEEYSISNVDRYENPELYEKMKRFKSMQPGSECNKKRSRNKTSTSKSAKKETSSIIKSLVMSNGISSSEKSNASHFFKQLTPKFGDLLNETKEDTNEFFDSPASILLRKMNSESNTSVALLTPRTNIVQVLNSYSGIAKELFPNTVKQNLNPTNNFTKILEKKDFIEPSKLVPSSQDSGVSNENYNKSVCNNNVYPKNQHNYIANDRTDLVPDTATQINDDGDKTCNDESISSIVDIVTNSKDLIEIDYIKGKSKTQQISTNMKVTTSTNIHTVGGEQKSKTIMRHQNVKKISKNQLSKRKTTYLNKTIETSNIEKTTITKQNKQKTMKRRTVYTPQNMEESFNLDALDGRKVLTDNVICTNQTLTTKTDEDIRNISKKKSDLFGEDSKCSVNKTLDLKLNISEFTDTSILEKKTLNEQELQQYSINNLDPEKLSNSENIINEKQCTSTPFSSNRKPGRRRTFYDLTMDLITHRIQSINKTTRRSIFEENLVSESKKYENIESPESELNKSATTPNLPSQLLRSTLELESNENDFKKQCNITGSNNIESITLINTKKRKLFVPNLEAILTPKSNGTSKNVSSSKRRKTMNHIISHEPKNQTEKSNELEQSDKIKQTEEPLELLSSKKKEVVELKQTESSTNVNNVPISKEKKIEKLPITVPSGASDTTTSKPKLNYLLVYTNMHKLQIKEIQQAIAKLGKFHIENSVSEATTHVVSLEPRRTLNLLRALARGLWILEYRWITESLKSGKWLLEEPYEIKDFSRAVVICRSERQAFGAFYRCELFNHIGAFYISSRCGPISKENLRELILLCGGKISPNRRNARYILGDANKSFDEKIYVTPYWILDSITHMQLQKINKYSVPAEMIKPTQTSNQTQTPLEKEVFHIQNSLKAKKLEVSSGMRYT